MHKVELKIHHRTCWGSEISVKFPEYKFCSVDCRWVGSKVAHILLARGGLKKFRKITEYLEKRKDVLKAETLSEDDQGIYIRIITKKDRRTSQFSDLFFSHECFPAAPTRFEGKYEIWTLGTADRKNIAAVYNYLRKRHPVHINYLKEEKISNPLTPRQRETINYAQHFGYYQWPRKKTATEICNLVKIPKTVFLSHLRKAENKIIAEFLAR